MDIDAYLTRIGYSGGREPNLQTLQGMYHAHFFSVPFENLDIHTGRTIEVDEAVNFDKIVTRRRGGFCLELTGLFVRALRQLGFEVDILAARVLRDGQLGQPFSHMTSIVHLDEPWIADVGFSGRIAMPLRLHDRSQQIAGDRSHVLDHDGDHWFLTAYEPGVDPAVYVFTLQPRQFEEFRGVCQWL
ncbi:MAG: arylamine N-acetyltransferase, partial [Tepidiformaceae bacterium]